MRIMKTQIELLKAWLRKGRKITQPIAGRKLLIGRLSARILEIKNEGMQIESMFIPYERADGTETRIKQYYLKE